MNEKRIQKKKLILSLIMLLLFAVSLILSGITFAWLYKGREQVTVDTLSGSIHAAYFNGGNGTVPSADATYKTEDSTYPSYEFGGSDGPYQIDNATQLYNFAWLQYLGYFNDTTTYFVLTSDIDASDLVLPPVGTASSPFIGYFDGNGHTISGLNISNDKTKLNNTDVDGNKFNIPYQALENGELTDPAEIVGFFGVVGEIDEDYSSSSFVPTVKNVKLSETNIESNTAASLSGIAAGYVNGIMEDVVVSGTSTINSSAAAPLSYTSELSDYALVGFCEEPYKKRLKVETVDVYEPDIELGHLGRIGDTGIGTVWGNSIDMKSMYNEVRAAYDAGSDSAISYISAKTIEHYGGSTSVVSSATGTVNASANGYRIKTTKTLAAESGAELASYALIQQEGINNYVYLYGDKALATPSVSVTDIYYEDAFYIKDGENYLTAQLGNTTNINNAGKWVFQENLNGSFKIYTIINNAKKYLYKASGDSLAVGDTQDNWTVSTINDNTYIETDGLFLCLKNGVWTLIPPPTNYITDSAMINYMSVSNGNIVNRTDAASATSWEKESVTGGYKLKTVVGDTTYYLRADSGYNIVLTTDPSESGTTWNESPGTDSVKPKVYTMIGEERGKSLFFDGSVWKLVDYIIGVAGNDWGGSIDIKALNERIYHLLNKNTLNQSSTTITRNRTVYSSNFRYYIDDDNAISSYGGDANSNMKKDPLTNSGVTYRMVKGSSSTGNGGSASSGTKIAIPDTILPLNVSAEEDGGIYSYPTLDTNTGYIVGGGSYGGNTVRSASVLRSKISNAFSSGNINIYTNSQVDYSSSAFSYIDNDNNNLKKYAASREEFLKILPDSNNGIIHGLHFANTAVNASNKVEIATAKIIDKDGNHTYSNYELLQSCIDFNLKENGYINFFAGSYTATTDAPDSFFALSYITRNSDQKITSVTTIKEIWSNTDASTKDIYPYIYKIGNGDNDFSTGTDNVSFTKGTKLFDMRYLTEAPVGYYNALFYFEIPVNPGEYAMGCVGGKESGGAYLLYLDISANAKVEGDSQFNAGETYEPVEKTSAQSPVSYNSHRNETIQVKTSPTYYPLAWEDGAVSDSNTGYIISGGDTNSLPPGDIRVSRYEKSYSSNWRGIGKSLTNGILTDSKIYTYQTGNNSGWKTITQYGTNNLYKYLRSKAQLQETIGSNTTGDVFGMHFMDASISKSNLLTIPNATINGHTYTDYEMPRDSIDFTLKTSGYINVFAGTYFSGSSVDCFFSLHKIERDEDQHITSIREIKAIYEDNGSYNYQYAGGSVPSGTKVFDTACLTQPSGIRSDTVYYFEIPVSAGEFAIGSVSGGNGGYLLYLDISTHQGDSVITREKMTVNTVEYELPEGVSFEGADKTVFKVPTSMTGDISFTVDNGTVTSVSALTPISETYSKTAEKVSVSDQLGGFNIKRTTENGTAAYEYSERPLDGDDSPTALAAYFDSSVNNVIFTYYYEAENGNSVDNASEDIEYSTDVGLEITGYNITARAVIEEVTAVVQAVERSYIEFNGDSDIQTNQTIIIPIQTTTT